MRRPSSTTILSVFFGVILAGTFAFSTLVRIAPCPACGEWKPADASTVVRTLSCEFCDGHLRVTLFGWTRAQDWLSSQYQEWY